MSEAKRNQTPPRMGLVLEGGGAKGAYAMGCLLAFQALGLRFDAVAGTSVGALNAAILSTGKLAFGERFWSELSFRRVCKPRACLPFWFVVPIHAIGLLAHAIRMMPRELQFIPKQKPATGVLYIILYFAAIGIVFAFWIVLSILLGKSSFSGLEELTVYARTFGLFALASTIILGMPFLARVLGWSLLSVEPLSVALDAEVAHQEFRIPTYATVSSKKEIFDPDMPEFFRTGGIYFRRREAVVEEFDAPVYVRLDSANPATRTSILLASAAIPFGVFPPRSSCGETYVDGGLADNCPILPLISNEQCTTLVVVRLRPHSGRFLERHWQMIDRRLRVAELSIEACRESYYETMRARGEHVAWDVPVEPPVNVPYAQFPDVTCIVIAPARSLGTFLTGTMNFRSKYSQRLLKQGFEDAKRTLEANRHLLPALSKGLAI